MPLLLAKLPEGDVLQRLLDVVAESGVAREPGVHLFVIEDDGGHRPVLVGDSQ